MPGPRLEFTPQSKQSLCPSQMQVSGVGLPSCAIQCHQEPEGVLPPLARGLAGEVPGRAAAAGTCPPLPPTSPLPGQAQGRVPGGALRGSSGCGGCQGAWGTLESGPQAEPWSLTPTPAQSLYWGGWWGTLGGAGYPGGSLCC